MNALQAYINQAALYGAWIIGSIEDGPDCYQEHIEDLYEIIGELRRARTRVPKR